MQGGSAELRCFEKLLEYPQLVLSIAVFQPLPALVLTILLSLQSSDWVVNLQLQKISTSDPFRGLEWRICCGASSSAAMHVTKQLFAKDTVFQDADGGILTIMTQGPFSDCADFAWGAFTYR